MWQTPKRRKDPFPSHLQPREQDISEICVNLPPGWDKKKWAPTGHLSVSLGPWQCLLFPLPLQSQEPKGEHLPYPLDTPSSPQCLPYPMLSTWRARFCPWSLQPHKREKNAFTPFSWFYYKEWVLSHKWTLTFDNNLHFVGNENMLCFIWCREKNYWVSRQGRGYYSHWTDERMILRKEWDGLMPVTDRTGARHWVF